MPAQTIPMNVGFASEAAGDGAAISCNNFGLNIVYLSMFANVPNNGATDAGGEIKTNSHRL
jgi:hypothetical protein